MNNQKNVKRPAKMVQTEKTKTFRKDYPVCDSARKIMIEEILHDFMNYATSNYYDEEKASVIEEFVDDHGLKEKKRHNLFDNLFWWEMLFQTNPRAIDEYLLENNNYYKAKPFMKSWLKECSNAMPKFYFIGHKFHDNFFIAVDILTEKPIQVIVCTPIATPPKKGEIAAGILLPLGGNLYTPLVDLYHFDYEAREAMASCLREHYSTYLKDYPMHEAYIHVISVMLQIEYTVSFQKQEI